MNTMLSTLAMAVRDLPNIFKPQPRPVSYDDQFKDSRDGCARYDDVWGG